MYKTTVQQLGRNESRVGIGEYQRKDWKATFAIDDAYQVRYREVLKVGPLLVASLGQILVVLGEVGGLGR